MNDKLKKLASKMLPLFEVNDFSSPGECYNLFKVMFKKQFDYFNNYSPEDIIKLVIFIYSLKNTGNFRKGENILNNLGFATLFITQGENYESSCTSCGGNGYNLCRSCDGASTIDCDSCNGRGVNIDGEMCEECEGGGSLRCPECYGEGTINCVACDGTGEQMTEEFKFEYILIATWNKEIKNACELVVGKLDPVLSEYDIDRLRDEYIILGFDEDHAEFRKEVKNNEYYCTYYGDEPKLYKESSNSLNIWTYDDKMGPYLV